MLLMYFLPFLVAPVLSSLHQLRCDPPGNFDINLSNGTKAHVYIEELYVLFSREEVRIFTNSDTDVVNILLNNTLIIFRGELSIGNSVEQPRRIDQSVTLQTKGLGKLKNYNSKSKLQDCQIYLTRSDNDGLDISQGVENKFLKYVENCISSQICTDIGDVQPGDYAGPTNPQEFGYHSISTKSQNPDTFPELKTNNEIQSYINTIVDIALVEVVNHLKEKHEERIKIPDINQKFALGSGIFKTSGRFDATNGYFSDLTTLRRTNDAVLDRQGNKFSASCGFGLSIARIEYNHYTLKYGLIKVNGRLSADINGLSINTKVSVNYEKHPCEILLDYLKIEEFGKIKIKITGLGPLNSLASSLVTWVSKKWQTDIAKSVEEKVSDVINRQLSNLNCEKYRPKLNNSY